MLSLLNAEPLDFSGEALALLQQHFKVTNAGSDDISYYARSTNYHILWVRLKHQINASFLSDFSSIKVIVSPTTGLDHIDLSYCKKNAVTVLSLKGEYDFLSSIPATAELTWGLLLCLMRNIPMATQHAVTEIWNRDKFKGYDLSGKVLGIYGLGRIGKLVARYANAFGMTVYYYDTTDIQAPEYCIRVSEDELLSQSDIVTVHIPYDASTHGLFSGNRFSKMKSGARFVNTSRGGIIDETALLSALTSGRLVGAAVDVVSSERGEYTTNPLIKYAAVNSNLLITPHIGGASYDSMSKVEVFMAKKLISFYTEKGINSAYA